METKSSAALMQVEHTLSDDFLLGDAEAPGIHRRLIAGLQSMLGRSGDPTITAQTVTGRARPEYSDYDVALTITPGESDGRRLVGQIVWPIHITNSGATRATGLRARPSLDLEVWNHEETEATRFVGQLAEPRELVVKHRDGSVTGPDRNGEGGHPDLPETCVGREVWRLMRRIAERAAFALAID